MRTPDLISVQRHARLVEVTVDALIDYDLALDLLGDKSWNFHKS